MKPNVDFQKLDMLDLIFDGKNKSYGAYALRREYPSTLKKSILGAFLLFSLLIGLPILLNYISLSRTPAEIIKTVTISLSNFRTEKPKLEKPVKIKSEKSSLPKPPSTKFTQPVIVKEVEKNELPLIESLKSNSGTETVVSTNKSIYIPQTEVVENTEVSFKSENKIEDWAEVMPEFPGGDKALMDYLKTNIKYPALAIENKIIGKVILSFVVNKDGNISDIKIRRSVGGGLDEAAIKVVKSMPPWKPGRQNGKAVSVMYNLPINFNLN